MIRTALLSVAFVAITAALAWSLGRPGSPDALPQDQVSRAGPDMLTLAPAQAEPVQAAPAPAALPVADRPSDPVEDAVRMLSMGILEELKRPVAARPDGAPALTDSAVLQAALGRSLRSDPPARAQDSVARYTVQEGDSLAGIAFRTYGSTAAYLPLLQANADLLTSPSDLRAGMVLVLPAP